MPSSPAVSVILTVYNRERFAAQAIDSILAQTLADFELIIVDDGSADNSPKVIADYARRDSRISVVTQPNAGLSAARNAGAKKARADLIAFMDDDDYSLPTRLEKQAAFLRSHSDADCCVPWTSVMDEAGKLIRIADKPTPPLIFPAEFAQPPCLIGARAMIRRRAFEEVGGFREYFKIIEDFDFTLRFFDARRIVGVVAEDLYRQRIHRGRSRTNLTGGHPLREFKYIAAVLISANYRRLQKADPIDANSHLAKVMEDLGDLPEEARIYLLRHARNCARRILRDLSFSNSSDEKFWEMIAHISEMSAGLERRTNSIFRWLLWQSLRYGRFAVAVRLIKNFAARI